MLDYVHGNGNIYLRLENGNLMDTLHGHTNASRILQHAHILHRLLLSLNLNSFKKETGAYINTILQTALYRVTLIAKYFLHCYMIGTVTMKLGLWYLQFSIRNLLLYKEKTPQDISWVLKRNNSIYLSTPVPLAYQWFPTFLEQIAQTISPLWTITRICIEKRALKTSCM